MASCPICKKKLSDAPRPKTHPFCSERCKLVDLGNWLGDGYVIARPVGPDDGDLVDEEAMAALLREYQ
ncbi:MAG TPA: DNA gyrase inhibitor YacG [Polyangiales bacterium]|jgi:endogenous inhibitor of DNA gyrase (YacG/DUF329 family)